jgi:hypothetical protein
MLYKLYLKSANKKYVLTSLVFTIVLVLIVTRLDDSIAQSGMGFFYLDIAFSRYTFESILASWGRSGIDKYLNTLWIHCFYGFVVASLLSGSAAYFSLRHHGSDWIPGKRELFFFLIPWMFCLFEIVGRGLHYIILVYRIFDSSILLVSAICAAIKYGLLLFSLAWILLSYRGFRKASGPAA